MKDTAVLVSFHLSALPRKLPFHTGGFFPSSFSILSLKISVCSHFYSILINCKNLNSDLFNKKRLRPQFKINNKVTHDCSYKPNSDLLKSPTDRDSSVELTVGVGWDGQRRAKGEKLGQL